MQLMQRLIKYKKYIKAPLKNLDDCCPISCVEHCLVATDWWALRCLAMVMESPWLPACCTPRL